MARCFTLILLLFISSSTITAQGQSIHQNKLGAYVNNRIESKIPATDSTKFDTTLKDPAVAFQYSFFGTLFPTALGYTLMDMASYDSGSKAFGAAIFITGLVAGPGFGHIYAENRGEAYSGMALRGAGLALTVIGIRNLDLCLGTCGGSNTSNGSGAGLLILGGAVLTIGNAIHDIVTSSDAAHKYNKEVKSRSSMSIRPYIDPEIKGKGVTLTVNF